MAEVRIQLLGGVRATDGEDRPLDIGPAKCQALLAALAVSVGAAVPVQRLVELVWSADAPRTAEKTLQSYVARLRKGLGTDAITRTGNAYRLDLSPRCVDVSRFQSRLEAGDVTGALAEWQGPPLAGLDATGLDATAARLVEQWLTAVETDLERLVADDPGAALGPLTELTTDHPFREGLWALLMTALYALGRQADALSAYRRARDQLVGELGVEPGPRLRELESSILGHDGDLQHRTGAEGQTSAIPTGTVSFAFSEVEDSSRLWSTDRAGAAAAVVRQEEIVRSVAETHAGHVFSGGGDRLGVAFHRAGDAAAWALEMQAAIGEEPWPEAMAVRLRIGIHTGETEERGGNYFGPAVNVAGRLATLGHGGQTLVSGLTRSLLDGSELLDLGSVRLDGVVREQRVHQLGDGDHPPIRAEERRQGNLPRPQGRLFGRSELLDSVVAALDASPVVTLVGPGGIGKTRLALEAARLAVPDLAAAAWLVELADVTAAEEVARAVADVLNVNESGGRSLIETVVSVLAARRALLVLDNCEHVVDGAADLAAAVADGAPAVRVLATSREGLGIAGEQLMAVGPLDAAGPAFALFEERARALDRSFDPSAHTDAIEEICRRLDGVPLAIELAAARVRTLPPEDLVERLEDSFRLLTMGRRKSIERHRTLRATMQWSFDLLSPEEQMLFRRLSIFAGSFDLEAAERVVADDALDLFDVNELLGDLVDRSMVLVESGARGRRFRLLEPMRQFGAERLIEAGNLDVIAERHAEHVATEITGIAQLLSGRDEIIGAERLNELWPNLRAAVEWASANRRMDVMTSLVWPIATQTFIRRGLGEIADWTERILELADPGDDESIAQGLFWAGLHHVMTHDRAYFARLEERHGRPDHVLARAAVASVTDNNEVTVEIAPLVIAELRQMGQDHAASLFEVFYGGALLGLGQLDQAEEHLEKMAARFRDTGPPTFLNWTLYMLAASAEIRSDHERSEQLYHETLSVTVPARTNSPNEILQARVLFRSGHHDEAYRVLSGYIEELLEVHNMSGAGLISLEFINMMVAIDRLDEAAQVFGYLDASGILEVEGPGFRRLVLDASAVVDADPEALATRAAVPETVDDEWALQTIKRVLDRLLDRNSTGAQPEPGPGSS